MGHEIMRCWINQPSENQTFHKLHGTNVLATPYTEDTCTAYLLNGKTVSMVIPNSALSAGWNENNRLKDEEVFYPIILNYLKSVYTQTMTARQKEMGLSYTNAETHDLAQSMAKLFTSLNANLIAERNLDRQIVDEISKILDVLDGK